MCKKRRDVFHYLRQKRYSIYFLQDTHLDPKLDKYIIAEWGFTSFFCSNNTRSRGVAILFNNDFEFKIKGIFRDNGGKNLMVHISTMKMDVLLVNIYGPNRDDPNFYIKLNENWNLDLDPTIDYCNYKRTNNVKAQEKVEEIIADHCLVDIWRELNPQLQRFTWRRTNPFQQSRLDFFLISENLCNTVRDTDITPGYRIDHSMLTIELSFGEDCNKKKTYWKFNSSLLKDNEFVQEVNDTIEKLIQQYAALPYDRDNLSKTSSKDIQFTISDQLFLDVPLMEIRSKTIAYATMKKKTIRVHEEELETKIRLIEKRVNKTELDLENLKAANENLVDIRQKKIEGVLLRSRARWVGEGEKITK